VWYCDASAWVKRYVEEPGSGTVHGLFERRERMGTSTLGYVEVVAALYRRVSRNSLAVLEPRLTADWQEMAHLPLTEGVITQAADLARQYKLRAADAVHLATALDLQNKLAAINESVILIASDHELLSAARGAGLTVSNPAVVEL
jgi:predicted nucleic acid-binding protein